jgi:hypothetical protein
MKINFEVHICYNIEYYLAFLLLLSLIGCNKKPKSTGVIPIIDVEYALNNLGNSSQLEILSEVEYLLLQTDSNSIVTGHPRFCCDDNFIISNSFRKILLFNKSTGAFYKEIGGVDRGPNGYFYTLFGLTFNEEKNIVYAGDWDYTVCGYNYDNIKIEPFREPYTPGFFTFGYINDSIYAGFRGNDLKDKITVFNKTGNILNTFTNNLFKNSDSRHFRRNSYEGIFYRANGQLSFKEIYNDTLFRVTPNALVPRYILDLGKYSPPPEKREEIEKIISRDELGNVTMKLDNYIVTGVVCESVKYIFFEFRFQRINYWGAYDKKTGNTYVQKNEGNILMNGIEMPFRLTRAFINQKNQELVTFIDAYQLVLWIKTNPEKLKLLPQQIQQQLKGVKESDNPVVIMAKL